MSAPRRSARIAALNNKLILNKIKIAQDNQAKEERKLLELQVELRERKKKYEENQDFVIKCSQQELEKLKMEMKHDREKHEKSQAIVLKYQLMKFKEAQERVKKMKEEYLGQSSCPAAPVVPAVPVAPAAPANTVKEPLDVLHTKALDLIKDIRCIKYPEVQTPEQFEAITMAVINIQKRSIWKTSKVFRSLIRKKLDPLINRLHNKLERLNKRPSTDMAAQEMAQAMWQLQCECESLVYMMMTY